MIIFITSVVLFCTLNLNAQVFFPGPSVDLPAGSGPYQVIAADFNGDSMEDLAVTSYLGNKVSVWLGNGDGSLSDRMDYSAGTSPRSITAGDFNADNMVDIVVTNFSSNTVSILLGNGDGTFLANVDYSTGTGPSFVTTGDFNEDNKIDLVVTNYNSTSVSVLIGNGDGTFLSKVDYLTGAGPSSVSTGDFNGDSKIDLVVANYWYGNTVSVLLGNGDGTFLSKVDYGTGSFPISVTVEDFNGDNKVDLAVATYSSMTISVLLGNGDGTFLSKVDYPIGVNARSITSGDFNGDSKIDLAVATCNTYFYLSTASVFIGNGDGTFSSKVEYASGRGPYSVATGDFNGDNNLDLALANYSSSTASLLIGNGDGTFLSRVDYAIGQTRLPVTTGDFNGDNKVDVVVAFPTKALIGVLLGNGDGTFLPEVDYATGVYPYSVHAADFNGDNKMDIAVPNYYDNTISILLGNGDGTFLDKVDYSTGTNPTSVTAADFNSDDVLDIAVANSSSATVSVLRGNGDGTFMSKDDYATGARPFSVVAGDFNGDYKSDLALANNTSGTISVLIGNGNGTFLPKVDYSASYGPNSVRIGDFNADNKLDLVTSNSSYYQGSISIFLGNGNGTFQSKVDYASGLEHTASGVADFNGDNIPDLATPNFHANIISVLIANGDGTFAHKVSYGTEIYPYDLAIADFNGDFKPDIAVTTYNGVLSILFNQSPSNQPPTDISLSNSNVNENSPVGAVIGILSATSSNPGATFTFSEVDDPDNKLSVVGNELRVDGELNFESATSHSITIRVTDSDNLTYDEQFVIIINNVNEAPTEIMLSNSLVNENVSLGTVIGTLTATDPDDGSTFTFNELNDPDNKFSVVGNELRVDGVLDFEIKASHSITILVSDNGGLSYEKQFTITVNDVNEAPTDIMLSNSSVNENTWMGAVIGTLSATDPDAGATFIFSEVNDPDNKFSVVGNELRVDGTLDFENAVSHSVTIRVTDSDNQTYDEQFVIAVNDLNEAPTDIVLSNSSVNENVPLGTVIGTLSATDPDAGSTFTFSEVNDPDNKFAVVANELRVDGALDFETKANHNLTVRVSDNGGLTYDKLFTITVNDVNEAPTDITIDNTSIAENSPVGTPVGTFSTVDPEGGSFTYSLVAGTGDTDNSSFVFEGAQLKTNAIFDYETKNSFSIRVRSENGGELFVDKAFTINVTNVNEAPTDIVLSNSSVNENAPTGTVIGTLTAADPDAGATLTFSEVNDLDSKFAVAVNELRVDGALDFETKASHSVTIRVSDNGGLSYDKQFTITVNDINETPPEITISAPMDPLVVNNSVNASAILSGGSFGNISTAIWNWGDEESNNGTINGASVTGTHTYTAAGVYTVKLTITDNNGNSAVGTFEYVVIYDPSAGFVTGGGWIISPPGAFSANPELTGKATFGFVSKYQKGKTVPTGNTEFQFKLANLSFSSTAYEWLVISGAKAQYKGTGTINNGGSYGFMLTAIDGQINGGGGTDKFRIKIWDKSQNDLIVYDNKMGAADDSDPTTVLGGGSIVIHKSLAKEQGDDALPTVFALQQCYPNPFNPSTTIEFSLPEDVSNVTLSIYNAVGEEIAVLLNEAKNIGYYSTEFDGSNLTSGVYFYRIKASSASGSGQIFVETKKMILLK